MSRCDWYEAPARPAPTPLPRQEGLVSRDNLLWTGGLPDHTAKYTVRLTQMQDFQGDGSVMLDMFSDQVDELSRFLHWGKGPAISLKFISGVPLWPMSGMHPFHQARRKSLKFLMNNFQPRDLTATYTAQFRSRHGTKRRKSTLM